MSGVVKKLSFFKKHISWQYVSQTRNMQIELGQKKIRIKFSKKEMEFPFSELQNLILPIVIDALLIFGN